MFKVFAKVEENIKKNLDGNLDGNFGCIACFSPLTFSSLFCVWIDAGGGVEWSLTD
jgi:hypothetical protein